MFLFAHPARSLQKHPEKLDLKAAAAAYNAMADAFPCK
jgi:hypothetical protein